MRNKNQLIWAWKSLLKSVEQDIMLNQKVIDEIVRMRKFHELEQAYDKLSSLKRLEHQLRRNLNYDSKEQTEIFN